MNAAAQSPSPIKIYRSSKDSLPQDRNTHPPAAETSQVHWSLRSLNQANEQIGFWHTGQLYMPPLSIFDHCVLTYPYMPFQYRFMPQNPSVRITSSNSRHRTSRQVHPAISIKISNLKQRSPLSANGGICRREVTAVFLVIPFNIQTQAYQPARLQPLFLILS